MNKLEELIQQLCPDGVEYKSIGECCDVSAGGDVPKDHFSENYGGSYTIPIISNGIGENSIYGYTDVPKITGPAVTVAARGTIGYTEYRPYSYFPIIRLLSLTPNNPIELNTKFLFYALQGKKYTVPTAGIPQLTAPNIKKEKIPYPPMEIQQKIVWILDHFTELTVELTAELTARKKQYEYYRDELLTFTDTTPLAILGEVAVVTKLAGFEFTKYVKYSDSGNIIALRGLNVKNGRLDLTDVKYIDASDFSKLTRSKLHVGDMLFTYVGTIGQVALIDSEDKYYLAPNVALIRSVDKRLNPQYMQYYFQSNNFWKTQINKLLQSSSMQNIPMEKIRKFVIPLPSPEEQNHIVSILDKFDALCNDQTSGLPAEIAARQKQYEYYRDKLLTFKKKVSDSVRGE